MVESTCNDPEHIKVAGEWVLFTWGVIGGAVGQVFPPWKGPAPEPETKFAVSLGRLLGLGLRVGCCGALAMALAEASAITNAFQALVVGMTTPVLVNRIRGGDPSVGYDGGVNGRERD